VVTFILNQTLIETHLTSSLSVLDYLRKHAHLHASKESCHQGECGACLILLGTLIDDRIHYQPVTACLLPLGELQGKHIVTLEGLNQTELSPLQQAFVNQGAAQCGYCTSGFIIALTAFLLNTKNYTHNAAVAAVSNNICRCTGYQSIKRAITDILNSIQNNNVNYLITQGIIPSYFLEIPARLKSLEKITPHAINHRIAIGGGTDVFVQQKTINKPLEFLSSHQELQGIYIKDNACYIGAETSIEALRCSPVIKSILPSLEQDLLLFAAQPLRHRATVAGNLVNASPIADLSVILLALNAELTLFNQQQTHPIALKDFFIHYKHTAKQPDDLVKTIKIPLPLGLFQYQKVAKRQHLDIASVNSAIQIHLTNTIIQQAYIAVGGVAEIPLYLQASSTFLGNQPISKDTVMQLLKIVQTEISPISDIRGSSDYKRLLLQQLMIKHFLSLFPEHLAWQDLQFQGVLT